MKDKVKKAGLDWVVDSAGTAKYHIGSAPHHLSQKVAKKYGVDICEQCCRQFKKDDLDNFDKIYVMDKDNFNEVKRISKELWDKNKVEMLLDQLFPEEHRGVPDPWYGDEPDYDKVYKMIDKACDAIIEKYAQTINA
jgi:protein-tyrosine phosphatase